MTAMLAPVLTLRTSGLRTLLQQAIAAIRRNNGALFYVPSNFAGSWTDSAGTDPVNEVADVIGRMTDRTGGTGVATQATTANKPTVQVNAQGWNVMRFDGSNDSLTTDITTGNEGWVCAGVSITDSNSTIVCSGAGNNTQKGIWAYRTASNDAVNILVGNGTLVSNAVVRPMPAGVPCVWEGWWTATTVGQAVDGVGASDAARTGDASPPPSTLRIGAYTDGVTFPLAGEMTAQVICPVLPSAADRALIRKLIGSLQGQTL